MSQLQVTNLSIGYDGKVIHEGINFTVNEGDYLCIVGENGAGKSTLMKTMLGLQKPIAGEIELSDGMTKKDIGYLPQQSLIQRDFPASVWEIVISGCLSASGLKPFYSKQQKKLARENMVKMGIDGFAKRCYRELSGGQQQRVLLARALCASGKILLLDEPVAGLDPKVTQEMYDLIAALNKEGLTIIMVSHDISAALHFASHILHVADDIFYGTKDEYLKSPAAAGFLIPKGGEM